MAVAAGVVAGPAAEQVVDGDAEGLAAQIPEGEVDGGEGGGVDVAAAEELAAPEHLPDVLDPRRVHADQQRFVGFDHALNGELFPGNAGLAEAGEALVGVDLDEGIVALRPVRVVDQESLHIGDFHPWHSPREIR